MDTTISAESSAPGAYGLGAYGSSVKLATAPAAAPVHVESRAPRAPFDPREKIAQLVLDPRAQAPGLDDIRREVLQGFVKRAAACQAIQIHLVEKRAETFDVRARAEGWDDARINREQNALAKSAMAGHAGAHGLKQLWWAADDPKKLLAYGKAKVARSVETTRYVKAMEKGAELGLSKLAFTAALASGGRAALSFLSKAPGRIGQGIAAAAKSPAGWAVRPSGGNLAQGLNPLKGVGRTLSRGGTNPIINPLRTFAGLMPKKMRVGAAKAGLMRRGKLQQWGLHAKQVGVGQAVKEQLPALAVGGGVTGAFGVADMRRAAAPLAI